MSYRLQNGEPLADGLKRIAGEQLSSGIESLKASEDLAKGIYEARKSLKRTRSILRLLEPQLGPAYVAENQRLRDAARRFSALRDANVSLEVLEGFASRYKRQSTLNPHRKTLLERQALLKAQTDWRTQLNEAAGTLAAAQKRIEDWPLHGLTKASIEHQIMKTCQESRRALKKVTLTRSPEDFHELRKSVKRELNQLRLFDPSQERVRPLKLLSSLLGDHHNLVILGASLAHTSARFRQLTRRRQKEYESQVLSLAAPLYDIGCLKPFAVE